MGTSAARVGQRAGGDFTEVFLEERDGALEVRLPFTTILLSQQASIGEVVYKAPEDAHAVFVVLLGVQDVVVPDLVDDVEWHRTQLGVHGEELEEAAVQLDGCERLILCHPLLARSRLDELDGDGFEVELADQTKLSLECRFRPRFFCKGRQHFPLVCFAASQQSEASLYNRIVEESNYHDKRLAE